MFLDTTSKSVRVFLSGAVTTNQAVVNSDWGDNTATTYTAGSADFLTNGATPVTIVAAPAASTQRIVQRINVYNADTAPITVTIQTVNGANNRTEVTVTLQVAERLEFVKEQGWSTYNAQGSRKVVAVTSTVEPGYIDGLQMVWNSATSVSVTSGTCYIPASGFNINFPSTITKAGLALSNNTMYHVYGFLNSGVPDVEIVTTAPSAAYNGVARTKTGDTTRRYIGSILTNGSGQVRNFLHTPTNGYIGIQENTNASPYLVLVGGVATVATTISCAGFAPPTCRAIVLLASNGSTNSTIAIANPDITGALTTTNWTQIVPFVSTGNMQLGLTISLSSAQAFNYIYSVAPSPGGADIRATGYYYDR